MVSLRTLAIAAAATAMCTAAVAQIAPTPAPPPPPPPAQDSQRPQPPDMGGPRDGMRAPPGGMHHFGGPGGPGGPGGFGGGPGGRGERGGPPPMGKGAFLRYDKQGGVTLKCPDEESTKACLDAAQPLIEKILQAR